MFAGERISFLNRSNLHNLQVRHGSNIALLALAQLSGKDVSRKRVANLDNILIFVFFENERF